jgi:hypothetical protein
LEANGSGTLTVNAAAPTGKRHHSEHGDAPDSDQTGDDSHETPHAADPSAHLESDHLAEAIAEGHQCVYAKERVDAETGETVLAIASEKQDAFDRVMADWDS